jgi:hypothetical protein
MSNQPRAGVRRHARFRLRSVVAATGTVLALAAAAIPLSTASAAADTGSVWGGGGTVTVPVSPAGDNQPPANLPAAADRLTPPRPVAAGSPSATGRAVTPQGSGSGQVYVPHGQGQIPWHQYSDTRLTDSLVARVDLSDGNFMLAATDFDIAGVGDSLQLAHTYSSFPDPYGDVSATWFLSTPRAA